MSKRTPYQGVGQIARYNARFYLLALPLCALLAGFSRWRKTPRPLRTLALGGAGVTAWWSVASLLASYWVYDRSPLYRWQWVADLLPHSPRRWANLHCGLDESSEALHELFPGSDGITLDFFDDSVMSEPAIYIARQTGKPQKDSLVNFRNLPVAPGHFDTIFLFFSAHEIREAALRLQFFRELHRVLEDDGRVVLAEHPRDAMNFVAFGPGFLHFWSRCEWRRLAREAGFEVLREESITPFVRLWLLTKTPQKETAP